VLTTLGADLAMDSPNWFYSSGAGGIGALLASIVALIGVFVLSGRQRSTEKAKHDQDKIRADADRCWGMFTWVVDNETVDINTLIGILDHLTEQALRLNETTLLAVLTTYNDTVRAALANRP
jgi:hypothetical protein